MTVADPFQLLMRRKLLLILISLNLKWKRLSEKKKQNIYQAPLAVIDVHLVEESFREHSCPKKKNVIKIVDSMMDSLQLFFFSLFNERNPWIVTYAVWGIPLTELANACGWTRCNLSHGRTGAGKMNRRMNRWIFGGLELNGCLLLFQWMSTVK